jgi:hypothetical protein
MYCLTFVSVLGCRSLPVPSVTGGTVLRIVSWIRLTFLWLVRVLKALECSLLRA